MLKMAMKADLRSRFQGCLVGAVSGDCLGAPYEVTGVSVRPFEQLTEFFKGLGKAKKKLEYTDDTAMARSVAQSLIDNQGNFNSKDLARKFAAEFKSEPGRGYGGNVITVLDALGGDLDDVFEPARRQFNGSGSYGNGGAMRVAPTALCPESDFDEMVKVARQSAQLTHSNALGYDGAILQCCAVHLALHADPATFDPDAFIDKLHRVMEKEEAMYTVEEKKEDNDTSPPSKLSRIEGSSSRQVPVNTEYTRRLHLMKTLLAEDAEIRTVATKLGNLISAHKSVPAAIYSFLRCRQPVEGIPFSNGLERTILYAISLDGDTDTIASMAGAIAGAFYGVEAVPKDWMEYCEGADHAMKQADSLYDIYYGQQQ